MSRGRAAAARRGPAEGDDAAAGGAAKHVVISIFDSLENAHYNGGGVAVIATMAARLAEHYQVTVVTAGHSSESSVDNGVCYRKLPIAWAGPRGGQLLFHAILPFAARRISHDVWIESFTPPFSTSFIPIFSRQPVVGFAQGLSGKEMWGRYRIPFFIVERFGLRFYRDIVVLNPADNTLVRRCNPSATVRTIPNGIDLPVIDEEQIGQGEYILFLGRVEEWVKGLDLLIAAYQQSGIDIPLVIAGSGTPRDERWLDNLIGKTRCDIRRLGRVAGQQKRDLLERSSFLVMPSRRETFGLSALEAMAFGKPVLHFDLPALRWMEGDVRVPSFDIELFVREMRRLAGDEEARRVLGRLGHSAAQRYSNDAAADRYLALVTELLGTASAGSEAEDARLCQ
jgi:glycosyltransferase involved in cell wall biosynthesis